MAQKEFLAPGMAGQKWCIMADRKPNLIEKVESMTGDHHFFATWMRTQKSTAVRTVTSSPVTADEIDMSKFFRHMTC